MNVIEEGEGGILVEAQWAEENHPAEPEASLLLDGLGDATSRLGNVSRVEQRSEKAAPLRGATCKEFGICVGKVVK